MSQTEAAPAESFQKSTLSEASPQSVYDKCVALARNLWWTWHPEVINLFRDLDPIRWRQLDHNPIALLAEFTPEQFHVGLNSKLMGQVNVALVAQQYLSDGGSITLTSGILADQPIRFGTGASMVNAAVEGFARGAAIELPRGLRINVVNVEDRATPPAPLALRWHQRQVEVAAAGPKAGKARRRATELQRESKSLVEGNRTSHVVRGQRDRTDARQH